MTQPPLFSVVIPVYNRAHLIGTTISSVLQQNFEDFELLVIDDGSNDNTGYVVSSFNDDRIKYFWKENEERAAARNYGVQNATGSYITFVDSDDLLKAEHLLQASIFLQANQAEVFHLGYDVVDEMGRMLKPWKKLPDPTNDKLLKGNYLSCLGVFVKREILLQHLFNEDKRLSGSEDYELWLRLSAHFPIRTLPKSTALLVNHPQRSVLVLDFEKFEKRIELFHYLILNNRRLVQTYGNRLKIVTGFMDLYAALHLVMAGYKIHGIKALVKACWNYPIVLISYRFWVVVKKLIL